MILLFSKLIIADSTLYFKCNRKERKEKNANDNKY